MTHVSITEAQEGLSEIIARVEAGERIVLTRNGRPIACLTPLRAKKPIAYGDLRGLWIFDGLPLPEDLIDESYPSAEEFKGPK